MQAQAPGLTLGNGLRSIKIDGCFDVLCDGCNELHPIFEAFVSSPLNKPDPKNPTAKTYADLIYYSFNFMPLTLHNHAWIANKMVPYMIEECRQDMTKCKLFKYIAWLTAVDTNDTETP